MFTRLCRIKFLLALFTGFLLFGSLPATADVLQFDDYTIISDTPFSMSSTSGNYGGFHWEGSAYQLHPVFVSEHFFQSYYSNTTDFPTSGHNVDSPYTSWAIGMDAVTITREDNGVFDFLGARVTSFSRNDQYDVGSATGLTVETYLNGVLQDSYTMDIPAGEFAGSGIFMDSYNIDQLVITGTGSNSPASLWLMDDFEFFVEPGTSSVPEPGTLILFGLGLLGLAGVNRKKQA